MRQHEGGYTYLLVLFLVAGIGLLMAGVGQTWQARAQREKEAELLAVGAEMARALRHYHDASPEAAKTWPPDLAVLLEDRRFPEPARHLRRIYRDPMTGLAEWGLEREGGRIVGIHSLSDKAPFRRDRLPPELGDGAAEAKTVREWVFRPAAGEAAPRPGGLGGNAGVDAGAGLRGPVDPGYTRGPRPTVHDD
ncbi:type II secretion system GspH family protein [Denitromonas iodatirespirans]|uniref:Type II secretion system protein n=1 Tax=Denitromonas iodatirespirans TaxID=2795389 RepID=A0A944DE85_DENI1|nr:type II secretion system GspH family protein [Denitromonas iodatirespirans]MBT0962717.1 type II secretion system protein [Denitromonas iodatirespirans]